MRDIEAQAVVNVNNQQELSHGQFVNENFQFFVAMNAPFAATDVHLAPLSELDDGYNDLVLLRGANGGRVRMARLLTNMETGDYFTETTGAIRENLPIDYVKAKTWELRPTTKVPINIAAEENKVSEVGQVE